MLTTVLAETLGTFFFVSVILASTSLKDALMVPLVIGLALTISIYFTSKASLGAMNPVVALSLLLRGDLDLPTTAVYIVAEVLGAVLAFVWWKLVWGKKKV